MTGFEHRALYKANELDHVIPQIIEDAERHEDFSTCTRCGHGVLQRQARVVRLRREQIELQANSAAFTTIR